ncbi:MAG: hypothetical protein ACJA2N_000631 [Salibacteraceae bacterium]
MIWDKCSFLLVNWPFEIIYSFHSEIPYLAEGRLRDLCFCGF